MIKWLIRIIWGSNCTHDWKQIKRNETPTQTKFLFVCNKCGCFNKKTI